MFGYGTGACAGKLETVTHGTESAEFSYFGALPAGFELEGVLDAAVSVVYDDFLRPASFTYAGAAESYTYDKDDLVTSAGGFTIARNAGMGFPTSIGDGTLSTVPTINGYGEISALEYKVGGVEKANWALGIDDTGQIYAKTEDVSGATTSYAYEYTDLGQLEEVEKNSTVVEEYGYDDNGNRTYQKVGGVERWLTYDDEDRLDKVYSDSTHTTQVAEYDYDVDGFLTTKTEGSDVTTYDYNSQGQLLEVVLPDTTVIEYRHDALGRRVAKVVDSVVTEKYLWAGMNQGLLAVYNGSDQLLVRYKYAGGRLPVSFTYDSATWYPVYDQVGSLRAIYNTSGTKVHEITYDSFGNILSESGSFAGPIPHGFAGGLHDRQTGLVRFGYRDYNPKVGRWTAKDPIGFAGGDVSLYGYVLQNPIKGFDPTGLNDPNHFTFGLGFSLSGTLGIFGFSVGPQVVADSCGNVGITLTAAGGPALGVGGTINATAQYTGADTVTDLRGNGWAGFGGSIPVVPDPLFGVVSVGVEGVPESDFLGTDYGSIGGSIGLGARTPEVHAFYGSTWVSRTFNPLNWLARKLAGGEGPCGCPRPESGATGSW